MQEVGVTRVSEEVMFSEEVILLGCRLLYNGKDDQLAE